MVFYKLGGKKGTTLKLKEAEDLVVIRTKKSLPLKEITLGDTAKSLQNQLVIIASFPEANVSIYRCVGLGSGSGKQVRNQVRKVFKNEDAIHFAGRALMDNAGMLNLYTENLFVKFIDAATEDICQKILQKHSLEIKRKVKYARNGFFVKAREGIGMDVFGLSITVLKEPKVEYCHPELIKRKKVKAIHDQQWHLKKTQYDGQVVDAHVNVESAWQHTRGAGIVIAIIDDGVDIDHLEFAQANKIVAPRDMMNGSSDPGPKFEDDNHGTPCAGVACASGVGKASGVAPEAKLMPLRLRAGLGSMKEADAFEWAADHGADVISCSWGPPDGPWWDPDHPRHTHMEIIPDSTRLAIDYATTHGRNGLGCIITWAAGNGRENTTFDGYASHDKVLSIAACNDTGSRSVYSDFGHEVFCCFPSNDFRYSLFHHPAPITPGIWSTDNLGSSGYNEGSFMAISSVGDPQGDYTASFGGTSSACPGMVGVIALVLSINPDLKLEEVKSILKMSCDRIDEVSGSYDSNGHSIYYGYGRINAGTAVQNALATISSSPQISLKGTVTYAKDDEVSLIAGSIVESQEINDRVIGIRLQLTPPIPDLSIRYRLKFNSIGNTDFGSDGAYVSMHDRRRKAIGFSAELAGTKAEQYELSYISFLKGGKSFQSSNGDYAGSPGAKGPALEGVQIEIQIKPQ